MAAWCCARRCEDADVVDYVELLPISTLEMVGKFKGVVSRNPQHDLGTLSISPRP